MKYFKYLSDYELGGVVPTEVHGWSWVIAWLVGIMCLLFVWVELIFFGVFSWRLLVFAVPFTLPHLILFYSWYKRQDGSTDKEN